MRTVIAALAMNMLLLLPTTLCADVWVDDRNGDDANPGTRAEPFKSVTRALRQIEPGTTVHLQPTNQPYAAGIRVEVSGTAEAPIVVDGRGCRVSGRRRLMGKEWQAEGGDVFSRPLPNNAWGMERYWEGGFPLVWFDGEDGRNVGSRDALEPLCYFLYKNRKEQKTDSLHNRLFVKLPAGKTPDDMTVECIDGLGGIYVGGNHVTVRNLVCEYGGRDGFATHRNKGVVFENIEARYFMDQGMSHHGAQVLVRNAHFHHNAGCGVVDVYPECKVRYENCLIETDTWRGGVEFYSGAFEMVDCVIRANKKRALAVTRGAQVKLHNCLLIAPELGTTTGIDVGGEGSRLEMSRCTLYGFAIGLNARMTAANRVTVNGCAWLQCKTNSHIRSLQAHGEPAVNLSECLHFAGNLYEPASWKLNILRQTEDGGWKTDQHSFTANEHAQFASQIGSDADAATTQVDAPDPMALPPLRTPAGRPVGASIPQPLVVGPRPVDLKSNASSNKAIER